MGAAPALAFARARRRPLRVLAPVLGIGLAVGFLGAIWAEGTIAGEQAARSVLSSLTPAQRAVTATWQGTATRGADRRARSLLAGLGLGPITTATLLNPVRLNGHLVRPAGIAPLATWTRRGARDLGRCRASRCPVLVDGTAIRPGQTLRAPGVHLEVTGRASVRSAAPLGFVPGTVPGPPVLLASDPAGLDRLRSLSSFYRTQTWLGLLRVDAVHSWQLTQLQNRLQRDQATLASASTAFSLTAPFAELHAASAQARDAPHRLLLVAGGGLAALALFLALVVGAVRHETQDELDRLRAAGARSYQLAAFVIAECGLMCGAAVLTGAAAAVAVAALLASAAAEPVTGILSHSLLTTHGLQALAGGWVVGTLLTAAFVSVPARAHVIDVAAVAAVAALALAIAGPGTVPALLLAPLCLLAGGVLVIRAAGLVLRTGERVARRGPVGMRVALVGLGREPALPSLWVAFVAVAIGLGGFVLCYRATLERSTLDQAAAAVPLDATLSPGPSFASPLQLAPLSRWNRLAHGTAWPVRRSQASFTNGAASVTAPALGIPVAALAHLHGWRASDGPVSLPGLARRIASAGPTRTPGPSVAPGARSVALRTSAMGIDVDVTADLRDPAGTIHQVILRSAAGGRPSTLRARLPAHRSGRWTLAALELDEPAGLQATNGHQNGENEAAGTQAAGTVTLGPISFPGRAGGASATASAAAWRGVGAASSARGIGSGAVRVRFTDSGQPGVVRPPQPSDTRAVPVLVDPATAAAAGRGGILALTIDGEPVMARVAGVLARFPTLAPGSAGFVVADESALAGALDAQLPGQGRANELWISSRDLGPLRAALSIGALSGVHVRYRQVIARELRQAPVSRAVLGTLIAAAALAGGLAIVGLLSALLGPARDERLETDLLDQGASPRAVRRQLRLQALIAGALGVLAGVAIAVALARLAVITAKAVATLGSGGPPPVTVDPVGELVAWALGGLLALSLAACLATAGNAGQAARGARS
ncbi:MAG: hypothetical protein ACJ780_05330 [Solirubrobacteraceae bacterium]